jgi:hypothetical protein
VATRSPWSCSPSFSKRGAPKSTGLVRFAWEMEIREGSAQGGVTTRTAHRHAHTPHTHSSVLLCASSHASTLRHNHPTVFTHTHTHIHTCTLTHSHVQSHTRRLMHTLSLTSTHTPRPISHHGATRTKAQNSERWFESQLTGSLPQSFQIEQVHYRYSDSLVSSCTDWVLSKRAG